MWHRRADSGSEEIQINLLHDMEPLSTLGSINDLSSCLDVYFDLNKDNINNIETESLDHYSIDCKYYDEQSMITSFSSSKNPIAISINIQSLSSKFEKFSDMIANFELNKLFIDVIAIQETWDIKNVNSLTLPSFHEFIYKTRSSSRGGGVGFYIKRDLKFKIIEDFSIFNERFFESLCVEVEFSKNNSALFISLYRPPSHDILPPSEHNEVLLETLETLLSN